MNSPDRSSSRPPDSDNVEPRAEPSPAQAESSVDDAAPDDRVNPAADSEQPLREQVRELEGQVLRSQAELENYRKRVRREMEADRKYAAMPLLKDLVVVIDNLRRALQAAENSGEGDDLVSGVQMVAGEMERVLSVHGCSAVGSVGDAFDPNIHEAIAQQPSSEHPAGAVMLVHQVGYQLHDRVVRPAQVIVSSGPGKAAAETAQ